MFLCRGRTTKASLEDMVVKFGGELLVADGAKRVELGLNFYTCQKFLF
jgi:hypothetical protein